MLYADSDSLYILPFIIPTSLYVKFVLRIIYKWYNSFRPHLPGW